MEKLLKDTNTTSIGNEAILKEKKTSKIRKLKTSKAFRNDGITNEMIIFKRNRTRTLGFLTKQSSKERETISLKSI